MPTILPRDFFGEQPPERIIGTESECNVQVPGATSTSGIDLTPYIGPQARRKAGYQFVGAFLDNGGKLYSDVSHAEIDTPESLGPRQAAAADAASVLVLRKIVEASGAEHLGVHRHSGTIVNSTERTSGYHENYMAPRSVLERPTFDPIIASHLSSRVYAMGGIVASDGFKLSQKVKGISDPPITRQLERRTGHGNKPMAMIPPAIYDADTIGDNAWARLEVRFADAGFSLTARYLGFAATSLMLRLLEHEDQVDIRQLLGFSFKQSADTAKRFNADVTFSQTAETSSGAMLSVVDYQEILATAAARLSEKVELPNDEVEALPLWFDVCDQLRQSNLPAGEYGNLLDLVDFAPRYYYLFSRFSHDQVKSSNPRAVEASLTWDRILPTGGGMHYWAHRPSPYVSQEEVDRLVTTPPPTRARTRAELIRLETKLDKSAKWSGMVIGRQNVQLKDSYKSRLSASTRRRVAGNS